MNVFEGAPPPTGERFETLLSRRNVRIERIVSAAYADGEVYEQPQDEWVVLLRGEATLELDAAEPPVELCDGDAVFIAAHRRHRVVKCSAGAIWLAVHIHATRPAATCVIEEATPERIAALCAQVPELAQTSDDTIAARIGLRRALLHVASIDGEDAGFKVGYAETPQRFYSWIGGVLPAFRRRGVALALLEAQHAWCAAAGFEAVEVKTYNRFRGMLMMLMRAGYEVFAMQANGAIVLRFALGPSTDARVQPTRGVSVGDASVSVSSRPTGPERSRG